MRTRKRTVPKSLGASLVSGYKRFSSRLEPHLQTVELGRAGLPVRAQDPRLQRLSWPNHSLFGVLSSTLVYRLLYISKPDPRE